MYFFFTTEILVRRIFFKKILLKFPILKQASKTQNLNITKMSQSESNLKDSLVMKSSPQLLLISKESFCFYIDDDDDDDD